MSCQIVPHIEIENISLCKIQVNPDQPRKEFEKAKIKELAESIKSVGLIQPIIVKPVDRGFFQIIAGERRFRACVSLGLETVPVCIIKCTASHSNAAALIENIHREDLSPLEIAKYLQYLIDVEGWSQSELAESVGKPRSTICNYLRLLSLPEGVQLALRSKKISMGHAKALMALSTPIAQLNYLNEIIDKKLSVRQLENLVQKANKVNSKNKKKSQNDYHLEVIREKIEGHFATKTEIKGDSKKGVLCLHYHSQDDLERILEICSVSLFE